MMPDPTIDRLRWLSRIGGFFIGKAQPRWLRVLLGAGVLVTLGIAGYFGVRLVF